MPVETAANMSENRAVRRSGRQAKRTDKLEEFLLTAKRGTRKNFPVSLESGDPPSQSPTDAETTSEASFDGSADNKALESPERKTRTRTRKYIPRKTRSIRQTRRSGAGNDQASSENEDDSKDCAMTDQSQGENIEESVKQSDTSCENVVSTTTTESSPQLVADSNKIEEKDTHTEEQDKADTEDETLENVDKPATMVVKRGPIRTYVNKKKATSKNTAPAKTPVLVNKGMAPLKRETKPAAPQAAGKPQEVNTEDDDDEENDSISSSSSSSIESDDGGYDPDALYCICRQKHNKRYDHLLFYTCILL